MFKTNFFFVPALVVVIIAVIHRIKKDSVADKIPINKVPFNIAMISAKQSSGIVTAYGINPDFRSVNIPEIIAIPAIM